MGAASSVQYQLSIKCPGNSPDVVSFSSWDDFLQYRKEEHNVTSEEKPLHLRGISGRFLHALLGFHGLEENMSTGDFCGAFILPTTKPYSCSFVAFVEMLKLTDNDNNSSVEANQKDNSLTGEPTRFISHSWRYPLQKTLRSVLSSTEGGMEHYYWMDIFCFNQHSDEIGNPHFDEMLRGAMSKAGHTLFVCYPWYKPVSVTRIWCLFEVLISLEPQNNITFSPVLDPEEKDAFAKALLEDTSALIQIFINVDARRAEAWKKSDTDMIFGWIQKSVGIERMNEALQQGLCKWIKNAGMEEISLRESNIESILSRSLAESAEKENAELRLKLRDLSARKEILLADMSRFERVAPLSQENVLSSESIKQLELEWGKSLNSSDFIHSACIPMLLGTTSHHKSISGGVFPSFMQLLVSLSKFRQDVRSSRSGDDNHGDESAMSGTSFHGELRSICDLWERAVDGIISLDLLIDKLPPESRQKTLEPSDFLEFVGVMVSENDVLKSYWPRIELETLLWFKDDAGVLHQKRREETCLYLTLSTGGIGDCGDPFQFVLRRYAQTDTLDNCYKWSEPFTLNGELTAPSTTVPCLHKGTFIVAQHANSICLHLSRFELDWETFQPIFVPSKIEIPERISMRDVLFPANMNETNKENKDGDDISFEFEPTSIINYRRLSVRNEEDTRINVPAVFETFAKVDGRWWRMSEHENIVELLTWSKVQEATAKTAVMIMMSNLTQK